MWFLFPRYKIIAEKIPIRGEEIEKSLKILNLRSLPLGLVFKSHFHGAWISLEVAKKEELDFEGFQKATLEKLAELRKEVDILTGADHSECENCGHVRGESPSKSENRDEENPGNDNSLSSDYQ